MENILKKNKRKNSEEIGLLKYGFNEKKEFNIYLWVCMEKLRKREERSLEDREKFETYKQWKEYIKGKYSGYEKEGLQHFKKFLILRKRKSEIGRTLWDAYLAAVLSALLALLLTTYIERLLDIRGDVKTVFITIVLLYLLFIIFLFLIVFFIYGITKVQREYYMKKYFYNDYLEIIEEIINQSNSGQQSRLTNSKNTLQ